MHTVVFPQWARGPSAVAICLLLSSLIAWSQTQPLVVPVFPTTDLDAVETSTAVLIRCTTPIERRSITLRQPDAEQNGWQPTEPTIMVLRDKVATEKPRSQWYRHSVIGVVSMDDDYTLRWKPRQLLPGTRYRVIVQNVYGLSPGGGGAFCAPLEYTFTTAETVPRVAATTLDTLSVISCDEPLHIRFGSPLPHSANTNGILLVQQQAEDGSWINSQVSSVLDRSRTTATIIPRDRWQLGTPLRVVCKLSAITGETYSDYQQQAVVRAASTIKTEIVEVTGKAVPDSMLSIVSVDEVAVAGASYVVRRNESPLPGWRFLRWETSDVPAINGSTEHEFTIEQTCERMPSVIVLRAVLQEYNTIGLPIIVEGDGSVDVYALDGTRISHVVSNDTVQVPSHMQQVLLVAQPNIGSVFTQWGSHNPAIAGQTAPTIVVPTTPAPTGSIGTPVQLAPQPYAGPNISKFKPPITPGDIYRLEAHIVDTDPDPMFEAATGVRFTTERTFAEVTPEVRTVCVLADRCWEIAGYHDPSVGPPVWFDNGRSELCLTSPLLFPINNVVIFARRKRVDVRVERILLATDDPRSIIVGKRPHPESRVDVERQVVIGGVEKWLPLVTTTCDTKGEQYSTYGLRCGDKVRFVVRSAKHRGEDWKWFTEKNQYVIPSLQSATERQSIYTMVVDTDIAHFTSTTCNGVTTGIPAIRVEGAFRQRFVVAEIGLRVRVNAREARSNARFEERWFDPLTYYDLASDEPRSGRQLEYIPRKGTSIKIKFSMPVDGPSVLAGSMTADVSDNILVTNPHAVGLDCSVSTGPRGNTNFLSSTGQSADIVEFFVCDPDTRPIAQALHGGIIDLTVGTSTRSFTNEPLSHSQLFVLRRMELPGFGIRLHDAAISYDGDWDVWPFQMKGEIYHAVYGADLGVDKALLTNDGFTRIPDCGEQQEAQKTCSILHSDKSGPKSFGDRAAWLQTAWMGEDDRAWLRISTWDEDCGPNTNCLVNRIRDVISNVKTRLESYGSNDPEKKLDWGTILPDVVKTGADAIAALLPADEQDDHLGEGTFLEDFGTRWGMRSSSAPGIEIRHENITYRMRGQWYVSRSVVR